MFSDKKEFSYETDPNFDFVLEERANTYVALRKIKWGNSEDFKVDIRKYRATEEGEMMMKGCSLSKEGTDELANILVKEGYGKDKDIYDAIIQHRPEITSSFINEIKNSTDEAIEEHLSMYPVKDEEEELYDLDDVIEG